MSRYADNDAIIREALAAGCKDCGQQHTKGVPLHFHHRDPALRFFGISAGRQHRTDLLLAEIAKCDVLCWCCHRLRHRAGIRMTVAEATRRLGFRSDGHLRKLIKAGTLRAVLTPAGYDVDEASVEMYIAGRSDSPVKSRRESNRSSALLEMSRKL